MLLIPPGVLFVLAAMLHVRRMKGFIGAAFADLLGRTMIRLEGDEHLLRRGPMRAGTGWYHVSGTGFLTNRRFEFRQNIWDARRTSLRTVSIDLELVEEIAETSAGFLIRTHLEKPFEFRVRERRTWVEECMKARALPTEVGE